MIVMSVLVVGLIPFVFGVIVIVLNVHVVHQKEKLEMDCKETQLYSIK